MSLTLGFLASVIIILPGLVALAAFNLRAGNAGARRPEQTLTSISALVVALLISLFAHAVGFALAEGGLHFATGLHDSYPKLNLGPVVSNPVEAFYKALSSGAAMPIGAAIGLGFLLLLQVSAVASFSTGETLDLLLDSVDLGARGWVFQHVTRPAEHGYAPIGHVFTSALSDGYGVAYKGLIVDIRQSEKGEILSVALSRPERFLYKVGDFEEVPPSKWPWHRTTSSDLQAESTGFTLFAKDYVGGVVALDAKVISNIVVHSISQTLLNELAGSEEDEVDDGDLPG